MRKLVTVGCVMLVMMGFALASGVSAKDSTATGWKKSLIIDLTTTQTAYTDSWSGGEAGSFNWVGNLNGKAEKPLKPWMNFKSSLKLSFGQSLIQEIDSLGNKSWNKPRKSTDLIDFENVARFTLHKFVDPYAAFRLESQFLDASVDAKKRILNPLKLTQSAGIARQFYVRDKDEIVSRLGLAVREIFKQPIIDSVTLETGDSTLIDGGLESVTDVSLTFNEKLSYTGKLTLFKAFFFSRQDDVKGTPYEDDWKAIDINWENIISAQVTKIITVNLYTQFVYDKQVTRKGQFKETLGIGFIFKLI